MRRSCFLLSVLFVCSQSIGIGDACATSQTYLRAQRDFEDGISVDNRVLAQILLIAAGYSNAVPTEHFTPFTYKALQAFQSGNGFAPNGQLDKREVDRLITEGGEPMRLWGFQKVTHPSRPATIWVPLGLGLDVKQNATGLHYKDRQGRLWLDFVSVPRKSLAEIYKELLAEKARQEATIHYQAYKDGRFVVSATTPENNDHYYRYHQDGSAVFRRI